MPTPVIIAKTPMAIRLMSRTRMYLNLPKFGYKTHRSIKAGNATASIDKAKAPTNDMNNPKFGNETASKTMRQTKQDDRTYEKKGCAIKVNVIKAYM